MATDLRVGTLTPSSFYIGDQLVNEIYLGTQQIYP